MNKLFTQYELSYLDDIMPGDDKNAEEDELKKHDNDVSIIGVGFFQPI